MRVGAPARKARAAAHLVPRVDIDPTRDARYDHSDVALVGRVGERRGHDSASALGDAERDALLSVHARGGERVDAMAERAHRPVGDERRPHKDPYKQLVCPGVHGVVNTSAFSSGTTA